MNWQIWVLLSGVLTGLGQMIGKSQIHKISASQMGIIRDSAGLIVAVALWVAMGSVNGGWQMIAGVMNGAMVAVGVAIYFVAVRSSFSGASMYGYLISQVLIVASSAFIFGEWVYFDPATTRGIGNIFVLLLTILSMLFYTQSIKIGKKWFGLIFLSALINMAGNLVAKSIVSGPTNVWAYFLAEQTGLTLAGVAILVIRRQNLRIGWENARVGVLQGIVAVMGPIIYLNVLSVEPLSLASLVRRIASIIVTSVAGLWWYKEGKQLGRRGWIGLGMGLVAFLMVMIVNR